MDERRTNETKSERSWCLRAWIVTRLCYFRPSELLSPKRKLQKLIPGFGSSVSLMRPVWCWATASLAQARMARPSEVAMRPVHVKRESSSRRGVVCVWENDGLAQARRARLSEMMWWSHCFTLAQARWASLTEAKGLAWAKTLGLSENAENLCLWVLFELFCLMFLKLWEVYACLVWLGLKEKVHRNWCVLGLSRELRVHDGWTACGIWTV